MDTTDWKPVIGSITENAHHIAALQSLAGEHEDRLANRLCQAFGWPRNSGHFDGLFGWARFQHDSEIQVNGTAFLAEFKKITEKREYGFWHAVMQGLLYHYCLDSAGRETMPVLCFVLDWGRAAKRPLDRREQCFLDRFRQQRICFVRARLVEPCAIEHNLGTGWDALDCGAG